MDLHPTSEQQQLRETLRRLLDRRLTELVEALPQPPRPDRTQWLNDALAVGLLGLGLPEDVGGAGTFADLVVAHEELGRGLAPALLTALTTAGRLLLHAAPDAPRDQWLSDLADGQLVAAPATEGSVTVTRAGDGARLDGQLKRVVDGSDVDDVLVVARDSAAGTEVLVRVPVDAAGIESSVVEAACDLPLSDIALRDVALPGAHVIAIDDTGLARYRTETVVLAAARLLGAGRAVLDRTVAHVKTREQFDRPIGTFQAVQHQLADTATELDATALTVAQAAWSIDASATPPQPIRLAAMALLSARDSARRATLVAHQLHGGMGFVLDSPLHLWSARAVADPTIPMSRRQLLDALADASGITATGVVVPPDHRVAATT